MLSTVWFWVLRIAIAILIGLAVYFGLPWVVGLFGGSVPEQLVKVLAALIALLWLVGYYYWGRRGQVVV